MRILSRHQLILILSQDIEPELKHRTVAKTSNGYLSRFVQVGNARGGRDHRTSAPRKAMVDRATRRSSSTAHKRRAIVYRSELSNLRSCARANRFMTSSSPRSARTSWWDLDTFTTLFGLTHSKLIWKATYFKMKSILWAYSRSSQSRGDEKIHAFGCPSERCSGGGSGLFASFSCAMLVISRPHKGRCHIRAPCFQGEKKYPILYMISIARL